MAAENCRFRNVLIDLERIKDEMTERPESIEEEKARNKIIHLCRGLGALKPNELKKAKVEEPVKV